MMMTIQLLRNTFSVNGNNNNVTQQHCVETTFYNTESNFVFITSVSILYACCCFVEAACFIPLAWYVAILIPELDLSLFIYF